MELVSYLEVYSVIAYFSLALFAPGYCTSVHAIPGEVSPGTPGSLQRVLCADGTLTSNTELILGKGRHTIDMDGSCVLSDLSNITISSEEGASILCSPDLQGHNFIFLNISELLIENVEFLGCGRTLPESLPSYVNNTFSYIETYQKAAVVASHVTDFQMLSVTFSASFGFSVLAVNLRGETHFADVLITGTDNYRHANCHRNETDLSCSGAGAAFIYSDTAIDKPDLSSSPLTFTNCTFTNNANDVPLSLFVPIFINVRSSFEPQDLLLTGATALAIYFGQNTYFVPLKLQSCNVSYNYGYSSAIILVTHSSLRQSFLSLDDCTMEGNRGYGLSRGGAIIALLITYLSTFSSFPEFPGDTFEVFQARNTVFRKNSSPIGGALYFYISPQNLTAISISFDNVKFLDNRAEVGSAFEVNTRQATFKQKEISVLMKDIVAERNLFNTITNSTASSSNIVENSAAFIFSRVFNITVMGSSPEKKCIFADNSPGTFLVLGGNIYMTGYLEFVGNRALRGGAISLYDYALLFFHEGTHANFTRNSAIEVGGAIYANSLGTGTAPTCVFQVIGTSRIRSSINVSLLNLTLRFNNNSANQGGNSIYANPLYRCAYLPESSLVDTTTFYDAGIVYNSVFTFEDSVGNGLRELSSTPERLCYCSKGNTKIISMECSIESKEPHMLYPGEELVVKVFPTDMNSNPVSAVAFAEVKSSDHSHTLRPGQYTQQLSGVNCTDMRFNILGEGNTTTSLSLYTRLGAAILKIDIILLDCPPGFISSALDHSCICDPFVTGTIGSTCDFTNYTVSRNHNAWIGVEKSGNSSDVVFIPTCPTGFCQDNATSVDLTVDDQLCIEGRTGILCGACKGNLSVVFGSTACKKCSHYWLFTILLYALAGILLVVILFTLQLTVTHGTLTTIIFYANIVGVNSNVFFPVHQRGFLFVWISLLNLELGFPICFYDGMNEVAKSGLQAVFPIYLLFICLTIILCSEKSNRVAKLTSSHGLPVLATTMYLSFSKMLRYVIDILTVVTLYREEEVRYVWFYDGNFQYFKSNHIIIALVVALPTLFFIVGVMMTMLFIKQIEKRSSKLKPFLDVYGGSFKDKYRYWFGVRLTVLTGMCLSFAVIGSNTPVLALTLQLVILCLFMVIEASVWPYRKNLANLNDLVFMVNFFLMGIFIIQALASSQQNQLEVQLKNIVTILGGVAFAHFVLIISLHIVRAIYRISCINARLKLHVEKFQNEQLPEILQKFERLRNNSSKSADSNPPNMVKLKSVNSVPLENNYVASTSVTLTEISLDNAVNVDMVAKMSRKPTFSHYRESMIED